MPNGKAIRKLPSQKYLSECFTYNRRTGVLRWKQDRPPWHFKTTNMRAIWKQRCAGKIAGNISLTNGYREVGLDRITYRSHRIIWKLVTGKDPSNTIDHVDRSRLNSRWGNLRIATSSQQQWNRPLNQNNTSGRTGVYVNKWGRWVARINYKYSRLHLGVFATRKEASAAREKAARKLHGEFYRER